jgi:hypothetical protein
MERGKDCYRVAAYLARGEKGEVVAGKFVGVAARAGEVMLRIGVARKDGEGGLDEETKRIGADVARECRGMGGTLEAIGQVIEACLADEILKSK